MPIQQISSNISHFHVAVEVGMEMNHILVGCQEASIEDFLKILNIRRLDVSFLFKANGNTRQFLFSYFVTKLKAELPSFFS